MTILWTLGLRIQSYIQDNFASNSKKYWSSDLLVISIIISLISLIIFRKKKK